MSQTKHLTYAKDGEGFAVTVHTKDHDLPGNYLGKFVHEDGIEPMGPIKFPVLEEHVLKLLRAAHTDTEVTRDNVSIDADYELNLPQGAGYDEPEPVQQNEQTGEQLNGNQPDQTNDNGDDALVVANGNKGEGVKLKSLKFDVKALNLKVGESKKLELVFSPKDTTNTNVKYESSDDKIVSINEQGEVTAVAPGEAIVGAMSEDGEKQATVDVKVE